MSVSGLCSFSTKAQSLVVRRVLLYEKYTISIKLSRYAGILQAKYTQKSTF